MTAKQKKPKVITQPRCQHLERRGLKFFIANSDDSGETVKYYGYLGTFTLGSGIAPWYIMKSDSATGTYKYYFEKNDYDSRWAARTTLPYNDITAFRGFFEEYDIH